MDDISRRRVPGGVVVCPHMHTQPVATSTYVRFAARTESEIVAPLGHLFLGVGDAAGRKDEGTRGRGDEETEGRGDGVTG
jgi:hypothetical protein